MVESVIITLIYIGLICALAFLVIWALGQICLVIWRVIGPSISTGHLPGLR